MSEILSRGKRLDNGEWVYGDIIHRRVWGHDLIVIRCSDSGFDVYEEYEVDPDTVGQYTGLTDKNGVRVFEGDIVKMPLWRAPNKYGLSMKGIVEFHRSAFSVLWEFSDYGRNFLGYLDKLEVIGNIHDNPELLEEAT